jgi:hypothetical protein
MASGAPNLRRSVRRGQLGLPWRRPWLSGVPLGSLAFWALRWMMPGRIPGEVASWRGFTWRLSFPTWGLMWTG